MVSLSFRPKGRKDRYYRDSASLSVGYYVGKKRMDRRTP